MTFGYKRSGRDERGHGDSNKPIDLLGTSLPALPHSHKYSKLGMNLMDSFRLPTSYYTSSSSGSSYICNYFLRTLRWMRKMKKITTACKTGIVSFCCFTLLIYIQLSCGLIQKCFLEVDFHSFKFPADIDDFSGTVKRYTESTDRLTFHPTPINLNHTRIKFLQHPLINSPQIGLLIIVKSATRNSKKRRSIRKTWGDPFYLQRTSLSHKLPTVVTFICGLKEEGNQGNSSQLFLDEANYKDIILAEYHDTYGNNTYKTLLAMRWAVEHVKSFQYLMIVDDDMYINPTKVIEFIRKVPDTKVQVVTSDRTGVKSYNLEKLEEGVLNYDMTSLKDQPLIMGQALVDAKPFRSLIGLGSKWSMALDEYPYNYFPPYVPGGAIIFDKSGVTQIYYGSLFTRHFWVDDVYIGIIAHKLGIKLTNTKLVDSSYEGNFRSYTPDMFGEMIAIHGLYCPEELVDLWQGRDPKSLRGCSELEKANVL